MSNGAKGGVVNGREIVSFLETKRDDGHPICMSPDQWETWEPTSATDIERGWLKKGTKMQQPVGYCGLCVDGERVARQASSDLTQGSFWAPKEVVDEVEPRGPQEAASANNAKRNQRRKARRDRSEP